MFKKVHHFYRVAAAVITATVAFGAHAACLDNVVLVHGNTGYPSDWNNTVSALKSRGYADSQIYRPNWGSKTCAACNDHTSGNLSPVQSAMQSAKAASCTGKIDVAGHSMGVTLAMKALLNLGYTGYVNTFLGIAGAQHGLNSCGVYPYNVLTATCGYYGLSVGSPLINSVRNHHYGAKMYSIKSYTDEIVCAGASPAGVGCYVYGSHTSNIDYQNATYDFNGYGHFGLLYYTTSTQASLIMN